MFGAYTNFRIISRKAPAASPLSARQRQRRGNRAADGRYHVDAIKIDPAIAFLGTKYHPERPYETPASRCRSTMRATFSHAEAKYDLIVYGVLGFDTALSHASTCASTPMSIPGKECQASGCSAGRRLSIPFTLARRAGVQAVEILRDCRGRQALPCE